MALILLDYGHGGVDPGAVYKGRKESNDVLCIGRNVAQELRRHGVTVDETRTADREVSLKERARMELRKNYLYFISFHRNAFKPEQANGAETFVWTNPTDKANVLAGRIQRSMVAVGFRDRGVKRANFFVLRETRSPAVLIEVGFIDNSKDNEIIDMKKAAIVTGISGAILSHLKDEKSLIKTERVKKCDCGC